MRRMERRMYKRRRGQAAVRRILLLALLAALAAAWRYHGQISLQAAPIPQATGVPLSAAFDQTLQEREITLAQEVWYAIQTGIFSSKEAAEKKAEAYTDRGAPGYVAQDGAKWRVFIACYAEKEDASAVRERLRTNQAVETYLHAWVCPQIRLRLSGMAGQLDVAEAGLGMMQHSAGALRDLSAQMDQGEITPGEALERLQAMDDQVNMWSRAARERFARPYPAMIARLLEWTQMWEDVSKALREAEKNGATEFSSMLKKRGMALFEGNIAFIAELNEQ